LHVKEKKGERVRSTPPTAGCFGGQEWPAAENSLGGGAHARVEGCGGRRRSAVAVGFQWVSCDGKGQRRCGSARQSSGRCSFVLKIDGVSESAWQHRRRRSEFDVDGASARMGVCMCVSGVEREREGSSTSLIAQGRERERRPSQLAIQWPWRPAGSRHSRGENFD
jgi:hypothetical protein